MESQPIGRENLESYDCVLIATDHSDLDYGHIVDASSLVIDTRNATGKADVLSDNVIRL
jgi:UDP-N-acetyl-D-glucosamine dehydrogenase